MKSSVLIIGDGYTALSAAYFLTTAGVKEVRLLLHPTPNSGGEKAHSIHAVLSTYFDQITRINHAFSSKETGEMLRFSERAFDELITFCKEKKISCKEAKLKRIGQTPEEKEELNEGKNLLGIHGYAPKKITWEKADFHITGERSLSVDAKKLLEVLLKESKITPINTKVKSVEENDDSVIVTAEDGTIYESEMVVLACHDEISNLVPFYKEVLIPYADQWNEAITGSEFLNIQEMALLKYSHIWVKSISEHEIIFGGARFLRKDAGIGENHSEPEEKISTFITSELKNLFGCSFGEIIKSKGVVGIRACDEKPVIGPHFGSGRIFLGSGYMGNPISMGFYAGKCIAEIINKGTCIALPRCITPERLRSLSSETKK